MVIFYKDALFLVMKLFLIRNIATNKEQLERLLALNQFLNIVTYYNSKVEEPDDLYINHIQYL